MSASRIYLDHNASAPLLPAARDAMLAALDAGPGNASSAHAAGRRLRRVLDDARDAVAAVVGARPAEVVFTSGATEANALALRGAIGAARRGLVTSYAEHPSVLAVARALAGDGAPLALAAVDGFGRVGADALRTLIDERTAVVSLVLAQPVTGALQPVSAAASWARERGALLHTDATQAVGKVPVAMAELGADLLTLSAHKMGGPQGIGALVIREGTPFTNPLWPGAQERGRRAGTEAVALAAGFGAAADDALRRARVAADHANAVLAPLREYVARSPGVQCWSPAEDVLPNTLLLAHDGCPGDALAAALDAEGVCVATGTACASGARTPPEVLVAGGRAARDAARAVRISAGAMTTMEDVRRVAALLSRVVPRVRAALATT